MSEKPYTALVNQQRRYFHQIAPSGLAFRKQQLLILKKAIQTYQLQLVDALHQDLGKPVYESYMTEIGLALHEISFAVKQLKAWMADKKVKTPLLSQPAKSYIHSSPLGVCLIIAPFNYPAGLSFSPLIAAIAAGNCCILKTSELTPNVSRVLKALISDSFAEQYIYCVEGGVEQTQALLAEKFDHIFFTGSTQVGRIIMQAAATTLTPVTLELGGKSPCVICKDADLDIAVKRIIYAKMLNAGQTCVAPDYLLVDESIKNTLVNKLTKRISELYGSDASQSPDFARIVNKQHTQRLAKLIDNNKVVIGGQVNIEQCYIAPTLLDNVELSDAVMQEEVFGPILPILTFKQLDEVYDTVKQLSQHPLAAYIYSANKATQAELVKNIQAGGIAINHCLQQIVNPYLPFGGVGESGMGSYHGQQGFKCFSHQKSVLKAATWFDLSLLYPPYKGKLKKLKMLLK